ncbi:hypothetical protein Tco_0685209 [Tanacetum coccineum]
MQLRRTQQKLNFVIEARNDVVEARKIVVDNLGLAECKASTSNLRRIQVKDIIKEVKDYLKTYTLAGIDISCTSEKKSRIDIGKKKSSSVTDEEPEHFGEDALPRPPRLQQIFKSQRSSNSTASSGSNPLMYQEMIQQQYELDRKAKMKVIERETNKRMRLYHSQRIAEEMKVLQIDTREMDPVDAAIINA